MLDRKTYEAAVRLAASHVLLDRRGELPDWHGMGFADQFDAGCRDAGIDLTDVASLVQAAAVMEVVMTLGPNAQVGCAVASARLSELIHRQVHP